MTNLPDFDDEFVGPSDWARMYRAAGLQVVPARSPAEDPINYKRPTIQWAEWENDLTPDAVFDRWFGVGGQHASRANMGLVTGKASGGVFCVDLDVKDGSIAMDWWSGLMAVHSNNAEPDTPSQKTGGGGRQILFRAPEGYCPPTFKTPVGIDIRGQGGFMMCPPSMHGSGRRYEWEDGKAPYEVEIEEAPDWLIEAISDLREEYGGLATGARERADASGAKTSLGLDSDDRELKMQRAVWGRVVDMYRDCPIQPSAEEQDAAKRDLWTWYLSTTASRLPARPNTEKGDLLEMEGRGWSELERKWRYAMKKWDKQVRVAASEPGRPVQPEPYVEQAAPALQEENSEPTEAPEAPKPGGQPIFDPWEQWIVPDFPMETLPKLVRRFVQASAMSSGADASAVAMAALAALSGALDHGFRLKMKRTGSWHTHPRMWVMLVGSSSAKKTPAISPCMKPLREYERVVMQRHKEDLCRHEADVESGAAKKADRPPSPTVYVVNDTTTEKLGDILSRQDRGVLVEQDEISGWIGSMDKYSGGGKGSAADRAFWLTAYNGGPKRISRLQRGELMIENCSVSFVGGIQPKRLSELGNLSSDGLLQRFLPVMMKRASFPEEVESEQVDADYKVIVQTLLGLQPHTVLLSDAALKEANDLQRHLFDIEQVDGLGESFTSFIGKLAGVHGSLMLLLHMIDAPRDAGLREVSQETAQNATAIIKRFIIPHALSLYRESTDQVDWDYLRGLASFVLTSGKDRFTASDFTSGVAGLKGLGMWEIGNKVSPLVAGGWLSEDENAGARKAWIVVSGLREAMAERRAAEIERKAAVLKALKNMEDV